MQQLLEDNKNMFKEITFLREENAKLRKENERIVKLLEQFENMSRKVEEYLYCKAL